MLLFLPLTKVNFSVSNLIICLKSLVANNNDDRIYKYMSNFLKWLQLQLISSPQHTIKVFKSIKENFFLALKVERRNMTL